MATNFLKFCSIGSDGVAFLVGASRVLGWDCAGGRIYTGSGLFWVGQWTFGALPLFLVHCPPHL